LARRKHTELIAEIAGVKMQTIFKWTTFIKSTVNLMDILVWCSVVFLVTAAVSDFV